MSAKRHIFSLLYIHSINLGIVSSQRFNCIVNFPFLLSRISKDLFPEFTPIEIWVNKNISYCFCLERFIFSVENWVFVRVWILYDSKFRPTSNTSLFKLVLLSLLFKISSFFLFEKRRCYKEIPIYPNYLFYKKEKAKVYNSHHGHC